MHYLLDVNVLVAWGWSDHAEHRRAAKWIGEMMASVGVTLVTSAIPQLGFVRVSVQRTGGRMQVAAASDALAEMLESLGPRHLFLADDLPSVDRWQDWCQSSARTTDAHLAQLAECHGFQLATLDEGIPGAFLIPWDGVE
jgi:uncharacterized protein